MKKHPKRYVLKNIDTGKYLVSMVEPDSDDIFKASISTIEYKMEHGDNDYETVEVVMMEK